MRYLPPDANDGGGSVIWPCRPDIWNNGTDHLAWYYNGGLQGIYGTSRTSTTGFVTHCVVTPTEH
jgi:hypothetical protein